MVETPFNDARARNGRPACGERRSTARRRRVYGALTLAFLASALSCSGEDDGPVDGGSQPIRGGTVDSDASAVFAMAVRRSEDTLALCTATLIERNLFLTARHCLVDTSRVVQCGTSEFDDPLVPLQVALVNATELDDESLEDAPVFRGVSVFLPDTSDVCGADIALVETSEQVPASVAEPVEPRLDAFVSRGEVYTAVGYGGVRDDGTGSGVRRSRQDLRVLCSGTECGSGVAAEEFLGQVGTCEGDSGGPALDENGRIIGVLSRGGEDCTQPIYGSTTAWARLLVLAARSAAESGGYTAPDWATEPVTAPGGDEGTGGTGGTPSSPAPPIADASASAGCDFSITSGPRNDVSVSWASRVVSISALLAACVLSARRRRKVQCVLHPSSTTPASTTE